MGKNLICALENIRDGKDRTHPELAIGKIFRGKLKKGKTYTVKVTPLNVWLGEGKPIECEFTS